MLDTQGTPIVEFEKRRLEWTKGTPAILGDGARWFLPKIDHGLLVVASDLRLEIAEALRLAREVKNIKELTSEYLAYQAHLIDVGVLLLEANYTLPRVDWKHLLEFASITELLGFNLAISTVIDRSRPIWQPLIANHSWERVLLN